MGKVVDITGNRYGRLTVIEFVDIEHRMARWRCKCDCGNEVVTYGNHLRMGQTRSCGCLAAEYRKDKPEAVRLAKIANTKHGGTHDRLFKIWTSMRSRCRDKNHPAYKWYGGKGVTVCDEWQDYQTFKKWAYENGYDEKARMHDCSIDRIDPNGNYCPENCRWADIQTQAENKTAIRLYEFNGERHTVSEWARRYGIKKSTLSWRLVKLGWPIEKALTMKPWECNRKGGGDHGSGSLRCDDNRK